MMRHPYTGRYMAGDCEIDCLERCAGLCGADSGGPGDFNAKGGNGAVPIDISANPCQPLDN